MLYNKKLGFIKKVLESDYIRECLEASCTQVMDTYDHVIC